MLIGFLIGMVQQNETEERGGWLEKGSKRGWGPVHKGRDWLFLHWSAGNSSTVNVGRQTMGTEVGKWVDVVEGVWRKFLLLKSSQ